MINSEDINGEINSMYSKMQQENPKSIDKISVREFEWYEIETKIRLYLYKLLEPHLKTFIEEKQMHELQQEKFNKHVQDYNDFKKICLEDGCGISIIEILSQKTDDLAMGIEQIKKTIQYEVRQTSNITDQLTFVNNQHEISIKKLGEFKNDFQTELNKTHGNNHEFKIELTKIIEVVGKDLVKHEDHVRSEIASINIKMRDTNDTINSFNISQDELKARADSNFSTQNEHYKLLIKNSKLIESLKQDSLVIRELEAKTIKASHGWQNTLHKLQSLENYVEKYHPLYIQGMISDTLHNCLPENLKSSLAQFEEEKFAEMHNVILRDTGQAKLQDKMEKFSEFIESIVKRNKILIRDKRVKELSSTIQKQNELIKNGPSEDKQRAESSQSSIASQDSVNVDKASLPQQVQFTKYAANPRYGDVDNMRQQIEDLIEDKLKELKEEFQIKITQITNQLPILDSQINSNFQSLQKLIDTTKQEILTQLKLDSDRLGQISQQMAPLPQSLQSLVSAQSKTMKYLQQILQYCVLNQHLSFQDEIDKQAVALFGINEVMPNEKSIQSPIRFDPNCITCSGQPALLLSAFKLACLIYEPKVVTIEGKEFKREKLLEVGQLILKQLKIELDDLIDVTQLASPHQEQWLKSFNQLFTSQNKEGLSQRGRQMYDRGQSKPTSFSQVTNSSGIKGTRLYNTNQDCNTENSMDEASILRLQSDVSQRPFQYRNHSKTDQGVPKSSRLYEGSLVFGKDKQSYILGKVQQQKVLLHQQDSIEGQAKQSNQNSKNQNHHFMSKRNKINP